MAESNIFMTDHVVSIVEGTFGMIDQEWYQHFKNTYPPVGYRRDMKTVRILLPRRSGMSTAAKHLWDAHHRSLLYFAQGMERDNFIREHGIAQDEDTLRKMPHNIHDLIDRERGHKREWYERDLVIFDGVSRMKHSLVEELCGYHDPFTKLFVLLG